MDPHGPTGRHTVVVGAGLAGLSAAVRLVDAGQRVTVIERADVVGGRTSSWNEDGMEVETGLHRYLGFYVALPRLIRHVGSKLNDVVIWEDEVEFRLPDGGPQAIYATSMIHKPIASVRRGLGNTHYLSNSQKLALARMLAAGVRDYKLRPTRLDSIPVTDYARKRRVSEETIHRILTPLTEGLFFVPPSSYSMHNFMGIIVPYWNSIVKTRLGAFAGGMTEVMTGPIADYVTAQGGEIRLGTSATALLIDDGHVAGVGTDKGLIPADAVVLAASLGPAQALLRPPFGDHPWFADMLSVDSTPSVCFQLELDQPCMDVDRATFAPGTALASFSEQSRTTFDGTAGRLSIIMGQPREHLDTPADELLEVVLRDTDRLGMPVRGHVTDYRKVVIPEDFPSLSVGNASLRPTQETPIPGLALAGDYTRQRYLATMEGAVVSGQRAAAALLKEES